MREEIFSKIKDSVQGKVITSSDDEFDQARTVFYGGINTKPAMIIQVANADDIQKVVTIAREEKVELAIRSGGHSFAGYSSVEDGLVIDLRAMKKIEIDDDEQTAWAETGVTASELTIAADAHDLVIGFGDTGSVGIGGITLGGGIGFLVRKFAMAIDNVLAAEVVTADGEVLMVDKDHHAELFWALRGGGGNFGVVTKFKFQLHPLKQVLGGLLLTPAEPEILTHFVTEAEKSPDELSIIFNVMPAPPMPFLPKELHGKLCIMAMIMYAGEPAEGEKVLAPFRNHVKPLADMIKPMRYKDIFFPENDSYHPTAVSTTMMMDHVDLPLAEKIMDQLEALQDAPMRAVQIRTLGGAMAKVSTDETAFAHRKSKLLVNIAAFYTTEAEKNARSQWVNKLAEVLRQEDTGVYVGFLGSHDESKINAAYPEKTLEKLRTVKKKYDPNNLFHNNFNIKP